MQSVVPAANGEDPVLTVTAAGRAASTAGSAVELQFLNQPAAAEQAGQRVVEPVHRSARYCPACRDRTGRSGSSGRIPVRRTSGVRRPLSAGLRRRSGCHSGCRYRWYTRPPPRALRIPRPQRWEIPCRPAVQPDPSAEFPLGVARCLEAEPAQFVHGIAKCQQAIGRHRGVIGVAAAFIGAHDFEPLGEVQGESSSCGYPQCVPGRLSPSMAMPQQGVALQPFCGALMSMSTPMAFISTQAAPDAMQSSTIRPPTSCTAAQTADEIVVRKQHSRGGLDVRARIPSPASRGVWYPPPAPMVRGRRVTDPYLPVRPGF